jgi:5,10-methylenetetrahydromethanopterin reductase
MTASDVLPVVSCIFAPSLETPEHIALAERLGYRRAWCYDSPSIYADPWMVLALAAERTSVIGLGPAALVPSLRHPMVTAAALATLEGLAPRRVSAAFGTGLTGRMLLGERPMRWAEVADYVQTVRALLRGDEVEWDRRVLRMVQPAGFVAPRPIDAAILVATDGPMGTAMADELGDGVFSARAPKVPDGRRRVVLTFGTVLEDGEAFTRPRPVAAAAPALAAAYHGIYEARGAQAVDALPGGAEWRAAVEAVEPRRRHLAVHGGHLVEASDHDQTFLAHAAPLLPKWTMTGTRDQVRTRLATLSSAGVHEIAYQPMGPDVGRELQAFAEAAEMGRS